VVKFNNRHHDLVHSYGISVSHVTMDVLHLSFSQPHPSPFVPSNRMSNKRHATSATGWAGTAYYSGTHEFILSFSGVHVAQSLVCLVYCFVDHLVLSFWPLYCLSSDLRLLIFLLVSSNISWVKKISTIWKIL
jgi:hypothetical protein